MAAGPTKEQFAAAARRAMRSSAPTGFVVKGQTARLGDIELSYRRQNASNGECCMVRVATNLARKIEATGAFESWTYLINEVSK